MHTMADGELHLRSTVANGVSQWPKGVGSTCSTTDPIVTDEL
jgi:hypothetical protein